MKAQLFVKEKMLQYSDDISNQKRILGKAVLFGADGGISGGANLNPTLFVNMYHAAKNADIPKMLNLQKEIYCQRKPNVIGRY